MSIDLNMPKSVLMDTLNAFCVIAQNVLALKFLIVKIKCIDLMLVILILKDISLVYLVIIKLVKKIVRIINLRNVLLESTDLLKDNLMRKQD